jgi:hypothetical protein
MGKLIRINLQITGITLRFQWPSRIRMVRGGLRWTEPNIESVRDFTAR